MGRAPCCDKVGLKKGRWTTEEDELLRTYIEANGEGSWRAMPKNAGRTDNEIKNYWNSHLSRKLHNFRKITPLIINPPTIMDTKKKVLVNNNKTKKKGSREEECSPVSFQEEGIILLNNNNNNINSSSGEEENLIIRNPNNNNNNNNNNNKVGGGCEEKLHGGNNKVLGPYDNDVEKKYYDINTDEMLSYFDDIILMDIEMVLDPSVAATSSLMTTSASWGEKENDVVFDKMKKDGEIITTSSNNNSSSSNSTTPDFEYIGGGIDDWEWEWESSINMVPGNQEDVWNINQNNNCNINEDVISWLWNDDDYREEEEIREGEDESKQNAIVAWLLS
ncbi:hypothetical protein ACFE04_017812 [Oxalis oulophora]